ncbi:6-phosphofructokinase [Dehalococcoidia bacterium]|nr:6-phosphofructokinase [Dehalococcoidia bacterium]MCL0090439.1 6-phosphofructokinase [Dehalococcoidia bacterium]
MGRDAGWIALLGGLAGGADIILIPEKRFNVGDIHRRIKRRIEARRDRTPYRRPARLSS